MQIDISVIERDTDRYSEIITGIYLISDVNNVLSNKKDIKCWKRVNNTNQ